MKFALHAILFLYIMFPFYIKDIYQINYIAFNALIFIYCIINYKTLILIFNKVPIVKKSVVFFELIWLALVIYAVTIVIVSGTGDYGFFKFVFAIQRDIFRGLLLTILVFKNYPIDCIGEKICDLYINACVIYILVSCYMLLDPAFRIDWNNFVQSQAVEKADFLASGNYIQEITRMGLQGYSGIWCSLNCSFGVILLSTRIIKKIVLDEEVQLIYFIGIVFMLIGNIFYGRTGLIISIISLLITCAYLLKYRISLCIKMFVFMFSTCIIFSVVVSNIPEAEIWMEWSLEPYQRIVGFLTGDENNFSLGESGDELRMMYKDIPLEILIHGEGFFSFGDDGLPYRSDIGWFRVTYFGGVIGTFLYYLCFAYILYVYLKEIKNNIYLSFLMMLLCVSFFIFELKGSNMNTHICYMLISICYIIEDDKKIINRLQ